MNLLSRLSLLHKFSILALIGVLMSVPPTFLYVRDAWHSIAHAQQEARGAPALQALGQVVQRLQIHRGMSAAMLGGNTVLEQRRPAVRDGVNQAFDKAQAQFVEAGVPTEFMNAWAQARQTWEKLEAGVAQRALEQAQSTAQHTALITSIFRISEEMLESYGLNQELESHTSALIRAALVHTPMLGEKLGIMRAQGSGFLARGELPMQSQGGMVALSQRVQELQSEAFLNFQRATQRSSDYHAVLAQAAQAAQAQISATLDMANKEVIHASQLRLPAPEYFDTFTRTIDALYVLNGKATEQLIGSLQQRVQRQQQILVLEALVMVLLLGGGTVLIVTFVRSITRPLNDAIELAHAVAQGDLSGPPIDHGSDEVGSLVEALVDMREHLTDVVGRVRSNADSVATASAQIAQGNLDLSNRTESQASSLEETASAMEHMTSTVRQNADSASQASQLAASARQVAA